MPIRGNLMSGIQNVKLTGFAAYLSEVETRSSEHYKSVYDENRDRIYSLAFWMTDNELAAETILENTFLRAFSMTDSPSAEMLDRALLRELREETAIGHLTLRSTEVNTVRSIRNNTKRVHLERAIVALPATERMIFCMHDGEGYSHSRIARTLGITDDQSIYGLHQARLQIRELVATMQ